MKKQLLLSKWRFIMLTLLSLLFVQLNAQKVSRGAKNLSANSATTILEDFDYAEKLKEVSKAKYKRALKSASIESVATLRTAMATDTIEYLLNKATGLQALSINNATSAQSISQYFDTPGSVTVSGTEFYAYKTDATGGISQNVLVEVYLASSDSIPTGAPLVSTNVLIDTVFGGGNLEVLRKQASFVSAAVVSTPYVVVITNNSPNSVAFISSDYFSENGGQEWLSSLNIFGTWTRSYNVNVGGTVYDADFLVYPFVSYDITADFSLTPEANPGNNTVEVTSNSPTDAFLENRFYNVAAAVNLSNLSYTFDFGDGSPVVNAANTTYIFADNNVQNITLTDTLFGWRANFTDEITKQWSTVLGTDEFRANAISISPNPATDEFKILNVGNLNIQNIEVYNVLGKKVLETLSTTINTSNFYAGVYFIRVISDKREIVKRIIIK